MKSLAEIEAIMHTIPAPFRKRWCGGENGACACLGCVQIGNRMIMVKEATGKLYGGDPEYIRESAIPLDIYDKFKITREEWDLWMADQETHRRIE